MGSFFGLSQSFIFFIHGARSTNSSCARGTGGWQTQIGSKAPTTGPTQAALTSGVSALGTSALRYGRDDHYDVISAFIKSIRGSDPDAALFWLARMLEAGEDARFIARRKSASRPRRTASAT